MDTVVKCDNCGISFINRQRRRKHYFKCLPVVNSGIEAEHEVMQDLVHCIEYIILLRNIGPLNPAIHGIRVAKVFEISFSVSLFSCTFFINLTAV